MLGLEIECSVTVGSDTIIPLCRRMGSSVHTTVRDNGCGAGRGVPPRPRLDTRCSIDHVAIHHTIRRLYTRKCLIGVRKQNAFIDGPHVRHGFTDNEKATDFARAYGRCNVIPNTQLLGHRVIPIHGSRRTFFRMNPRTLLVCVRHLHATSNRPMFLRGLFLPCRPCGDLVDRGLGSISVFSAVRHVSKLHPTAASYRHVRTMQTSTRRTRLLGLSLNRPLLCLGTCFRSRCSRPLYVKQRCCVKDQCVFRFWKRGSIPGRHLFRPRGVLFLSFRKRLLIGLLGCEKSTLYALPGWEFF